MGQSSESSLKYLAEYLVVPEKKGKVGTPGKAASVYAKLKTFPGASDLLFDEVTVSFLKQYLA